MLAAEGGQLEATQALLAEGADTQAANAQGRAALGCATLAGHSRVAGALRAAWGAGRGATEADIARAKAGGGQFLIAAAEGGHVKEVMAALATGAEIEAQDRWKETALWWAAYEGHLEATQALLAAGADTEAKSSGGCTPLLYASAWGHLTTVRALIEAGANRSAKRNDGSTPLSISRGHHAVQGALRDAGATS